MDYRLKRTSKPTPSINVIAIDLDMWFQRYLEGVLENSEDFAEIKDIIMRYDTLAAANAELLERSRMAQEKTEKLRMQLMATTEEQNNVILNHNNEIARLQSKLEESQLKSTKWQSELDQTIKNASQKSLLLGQVKM